MGRSRGVCCAVVCGLVLLCVFPVVGAAGECPEFVATEPGWLYYPNIAVSNDVVYMLQGGGLFNVIDVSSPSLPVHISSITACDVFHDEETRGVAVSEGIVFGLVDPRLINHAPKICVIDATSPATPVFLSVTEINHKYAAYSLAWYEDYLFIVSSRFPEDHFWLEVYDVTEASTPTRVGDFAYDAGTGLQDPWMLVDVAVSDSYAYVVSGSRLTVLSVSVPSSPVVIGVLDFPDPVERVAVSDSYVFAAGSTSFRVVDVSTPSLPVEVGSLSTEGGITGLSVSGNFALISRHDGLQVINVRVRSAPVSVGYAEMTLPWDVAASGRYGFVVTNVADYALCVFDTWSCLNRPYELPPVAAPQIE